MESINERRANSARWMAASVFVATQTYPSPSVSRSFISHFAFDGKRSDISMDRHASCVPTTYKSYRSSPPPSHGLKSSGGSFPCMFHVPTKILSVANSSSASSVVGANDRHEAGFAPSASFAELSLVSVRAAADRRETGLAASAGVIFRSGGSTAVEDERVGPAAGGMGGSAECVEDELVRVGCGSGAREKGMPARLLREAGRVKSVAG
mmetsp:Transcript_30476/g.93146  ORF Transcript_30476/g.93146 Transcript_30476/m.93146 type:complete len:209 (-) Transcript_30476:140-766(-)|eukprot:scaffold60412_cov32-Tisochrysis_lutea.AAC.3